MEDSDDEIHPEIESFVVLVGFPARRQDVAPIRGRIEDHLGPGEPDNRSTIQMVFGADYSTWEAGMSNKASSSKRTWSLEEDVPSRIGEILEERHRRAGGPVDEYLDEWVQWVYIEEIDDTRLPFVQYRLLLTLRPAFFEDLENPSNVLYKYTQSIRAWFEEIRLGNERKSLPTIPAIIFAGITAPEDETTEVQQRLDELGFDDLSGYRPEQLMEQFCDLLPVDIDMSLRSSRWSFVVGAPNEFRAFANFGQAQGCGLHTAVMFRLSDQVTPQQPNDLGFLPNRVVTGRHWFRLEVGQLLRFLTTYYWLRLQVSELTDIHESVRRELSLLSDIDLEAYDPGSVRNLVEQANRAAAFGVSVHAVTRLLGPQAERVGAGQWGQWQDIGMSSPLVDEERPESYLMALSEEVSGMCSDLSTGLDSLYDDADRLVETTSQISELNVTESRIHQNWILIIITFVLAVIALVEIIRVL